MKPPPPRLPAAGCVTAALHNVDSYSRRNLICRSNDSMPRADGFAGRCRDRRDRMGDRGGKCGVDDNKRNPENQKNVLKLAPCIHDHPLILWPLLVITFA